MMASFSEGLLLSEKVGLDPKVLVEVAIIHTLITQYYASIIVKSKNHLLFSVDPTTGLQVVSQGAISAPMYSMKGPSMIQSLYPTAFPLKHQQKVSKFSLDCQKLSCPLMILLLNKALTVYSVVARI